MRRILLVAPSPPPYGGMALQARLLEKLLRRDGISVTFLPSNFPFPNWLRFFDRIPCLRTILRMAIVWLKLFGQARHADVVHVLAASWVYFFAAVVPAVVVGRMRGKRVVMNYRGGEAARFFLWFGWAARPFFALADIITTPSEFLAEVIRNRFHVPVFIVPNIVELSIFEYRQRRVFQPRVLVNRHLEAMYDIESALRAFGRVQQRYPDASLCVAGSGSQEGYLRELVSNLKLNNVRFLGHVAHGNLPALYKECDILLNASRVDNFPGALIEASACGLAIVSTSAGGIPYIYQNERSALLVEPGDWQGLAKALERVLECPSLATKLTITARDAAQRCDWNEVCKSLYKAYGFLQDEVEGIPPFQVRSGDGRVPDPPIRTAIG